MGVDVIGPVLGIVFDDENGTLWPEFGVRYGFDDAAERQVVIGDLCGGRGFSGAGATECTLGRMGGLGSMGGMRLIAAER